MNKLKEKLIRYIHSDNFAASLFILIMLALVAAACLVSMFLFEYIERWEQLFALLAIVIILSVTITYYKTKSVYNKNGDDDEKT